MEGHYFIRTDGPFMDNENWSARAWEMIPNNKKYMEVNIGPLSGSEQCKSLDFDFRFMSFREFSVLDQIMVLRGICTGLEERNARG
ncbi:OLC1v1023718C1 [Oldenlandia corymbosa var. corymbosa]|uniref:OLC1v1023718C1 n=1 Tax=Oldenlandia corymbosa var. corymbosa TaxID=529605 RepID=A0AAV1C1C9_OLDCO|nr:OLC1v1023718C1 [Oldenlandia corymbosa var. corymbosa]